MRMRGGFQGIPPSDGATWERVRLLLHRQNPTHKPTEPNPQAV